MIRKTLLLQNCPDWPQQPDEAKKLLAQSYFFSSAGQFVTRCRGACVSSSA